MLRRMLVLEKLVRGFSPAEIADKYQVPLHTIYNDTRVIRSGKFQALGAFSRDRMVCQLYLNAMARKKELWRVIEKDDPTPHETVAILREDRRNDEMVLNKLPAPRKRPADHESWGDETDRVNALAVVLKYEEHFKNVKKREQYKNLAGPYLTSEDKQFLAELGVEKYRQDNNGQYPPKKPAPYVPDPSAPHPKDLIDPRFEKTYGC